MISGSNANSSFSTNALFAFSSCAMLTPYFFSAL